MSLEIDNNLKKASIISLEEAIAKAISDLIGDECSCSISNISYEYLDKAKLEVTIHSPVNLDL